MPDLHERCSDFDRLLLVRCMREDRMLLSAQTYIANTIGKRYIDSRPLDLKAVEDEAHCRCPIIALLSQGSDPTALVLDLAKKHKKQARTHPHPHPDPYPHRNPNPNPNLSRCAPSRSARVRSRPRASSSRRAWRRARG